LRGRAPIDAERWVEARIAEPEPSAADPATRDPATRRPADPGKRSGKPVCGSPAIVVGQRQGPVLWSTPC